MQAAHVRDDETSDGGDHNVFLVTAAALGLRSILCLSLLSLSTLTPFFYRYSSLPPCLRQGDKRLSLSLCRQEPCLTPTGSRQPTEATGLAVAVVEDQRGQDAGSGHGEGDWRADFREKISVLAAVG